MSTPEHLQQAVELAQLSNDLPQLPHGLQTMVGERGVSLSGGQKQRAAIARALAREAPILILDDALVARRRLHGGAHPCRACGATSPGARR